MLSSAGASVAFPFDARKPWAYAVCSVLSRRLRLQSSGPLDPTLRPGIALELPFLPRGTWSQKSMVNISAKSMVRMTLCHKVEVKVSHDREQYSTW